jgi:hypothetical protein
MLRQLTIVFLCIPTSCLVASLKENPSCLLFADSVSKVRVSEARTRSTETESMATDHGEIVSQTGNDQNEKSMVSFQSYTDTSRWRPKIFSSTFDEYHRKVGDDVGRIFEFGFKNFRPSSDNLLANIIITVLSPIILLPLMVPFVALALPVIMIKHLSLTMLPAIAFDFCLKTVLSAAFVVHHPMSVVQIVFGGIGQLVRGNSNSSAS